MKLSIIIPTKDRRSLLVETLATVIPQLRTGVELVIVDASADYPNQDVARLATTHVRYLRGSATSFDLAYDEAVRATTGEWVWLFSDDDWFRPGAVDCVISQLEDAYDVMIVNAEVRDRQMRRVLKARWVDLPSRDYCASDFDRAFADSADLGTFLGSTVLKRQLWLDRVQQAQGYFGTRFLTFVIPYLKPTPIRLISEVLVTARFGHQGWIPTVSQLIGEVFTSVTWSLPAAEWAKAKVRPMPPGVAELLLWRAVGSDVSKHSRWVPYVPRYVARATVRLGLKLTGRAGGIGDYMLDISA